MVTDNTISKREERFGPYGITIFYYVLFYILMKKIDGLPPPMLSVSLGAIAVIGVVFLVNSFMKISAHMAGLAGLAGIYAALCSNFDVFPDPMILIAIVIAAGIAGTARLTVTNHTQGEIYTGALLGFFTEYVIVKNQVWI